jgi:3D (Asp-Asp-Asp) domain-containing protein
MVGYVHTSYGARAIADVKADIDVYAQQFPLLVGIFLDEVSDSSSQLSYYQELYSYIMAMPGWKYDIINPGTVPASGYTAAATQIVTYESTASGFANSQNPSFATSANKNMFAMITYGGTSSSMQTAISAAKSKGYYGWVYVTDTGATGATYNSLPSFYAAEASYIASLN